MLPCRVFVLRPADCYGTYVFSQSKPIQLLSAEHESVDSK